jgi:hypothetical protein
VTKQTKQYRQVYGYPVLLLSSLLWSHILCPLKKKKLSTTLSFARKRIDNAEVSALLVAAWFFYVASSASGGESHTV